MGSPKETALESKVLSMLYGKSLKVAQLLINDTEVKYLQEYANTVSIKRLNYNDHGPVHMLMVAQNAILMANLLNQAGIKLNLEDEEAGNFEDSLIAILLAAFLHDLGMTVTREAHQDLSIILALPIIERILKEIYPDDLRKSLIVRSMAIEGIFGHMGTRHIHSLEAGLILIADGCDMEMGRARIPMMIATHSKVGDIHKYSASEIHKVEILPGENRPIKIIVHMNESVGFFQVEEVLFKKIDYSPIKKYIELYAGVTGREMKCYL